MHDSTATKHTPPADEAAQTVVRRRIGARATVAQSLRRLHQAHDSGDLAALCQQHELELLVLFGSAASPEAETAEPGDIDLAVAARHGGSADLPGVTERLAALIGGDHLDVMDLALADPVASHRALTFCEVLYADTTQTFAERQIFAINYYIETKPMRRAVLESLAQPRR